MQPPWGLTNVRGDCNTPTAQVSGRVPSETNPCNGFMVLGIACSQTRLPAAGRRQHCPRGLAPSTAPRRNRPGQTAGRPRHSRPPCFSQWGNHKTVSSTTTTCLEGRLRPAFTADGATFPVGATGRSLRCWLPSRHSGNSYGPNRSRGSVSRTTRYTCLLVIQGISPPNAAASPAGTPHRAGTWLRDDAAGPATGLVFVQPHVAPFSLELRFNAPPRTTHAGLRLQRRVSRSVGQVVTGLGTARVAAPDANRQEP